MKIKLLVMAITAISSFALFGQKRSSANFSNISIETMGVVKWACTYTQDSHSLQIIIERLLNGKWIEAVSLRSEWLQNPTPMLMSRNDSSQVKFHKGVNRYRIRMTFPSEGTSVEFKLTSKNSNDDGSLWISGGQIILDKKQYWEIIDNKADLLEKGNSKVVDISFLNKGIYWLYIPTATRSFTKS